MIVNPDIVNPKILSKLDNNSYDYNKILTFIPNYKDDTLITGIPKSILGSYLDVFSSLKKKLNTYKIEYSEENKTLNGKNYFVFKIDFNGIKKYIK